jgi:ferredoxin
MTIKTMTNRAKCDGVGNCVIATGDNFDLDEDGLATLQVHTVDEERLDAVRRTVYAFPVNTNSFVQE